jgi:hypothetical protein
MNYADFCGFFAAFLQFLHSFLHFFVPRNIFRKTENTARGLRKAARFFSDF